MCTSSASASACDKAAVALQHNWIVNGVFFGSARMCASFRSAGPKIWTAKIVFLTRKGTAMKLTICCAAAMLFYLAAGPAASHAQMYDGPWVQIDWLTGILS
jgi:hypothetical protein